MVEWLTGTMGNVGLTIPDNLFSLSGIFSLTGQILGLGWDFIRRKAVKLLGEKVVSAVEGSLDFFVMIVRDGLSGIWEFVKDKFTDLKEFVLDAIKDMVITEVIKAGIKWLLSLLNPVAALFNPRLCSAFST